MDLKDLQASRVIFALIFPLLLSCSYGCSSADNSTLVAEKNKTPCIGFKQRVDQLVKEIEVSTRMVGAPKASQLLLLEEQLGEAELQNCELSEGNRLAKR